MSGGARGAGPIIAGGLLALGGYYLYQKKQESDRDYGKSMDKNIDDAADSAKDAINSANQKVKDTTNSNYRRSERMYDDAKTSAQEKSNKVKDIASRAAHDARRAKDKCIDTIKGEDGKKTDE